MMKYRMYVDEVGNSDLNSSDNPNHRFLSLTGVIFALSYVERTVFPQLEALKARYFRSHPDDPVILHRKEMLNAKPPFEALRDSSLRDQFDKEILALLESWDFSVISVCLDKKKHRDTYTIWRYDPYHYAMAMLLERFTFFLERIGVKGDVMAESRGGKEDMRLKRSFERIWTHGTEFVKPDLFQQILTSKELKVRAKANNVAGLQVADLLAHPSRNEILSEQNLLPGPLRPFAEKVIAVLQKKYYQRSGKIQGHGKKFI